MVKKDQDEYLFTINFLWATFSMFVFAYHENVKISLF